MEELGGFDDSISMGMLMKYIVKPIKIEIVLGRYSVTGAADPVRRLFNKVHTIFILKSGVHFSCSQARR